MERGGQEGEKILNLFQKLEMRLKCTVSNKGVKLGQGKNTPYIKQFEFYSGKKNNIDTNGTICNACRIKMYNINRTINKQTDHLPTTVADITENLNTCNTQDDVDELVTIPIMPMNKSHNICAICRLKKTLLFVWGNHYD